MILNRTFLRLLLGVALVAGTATAVHLPGSAYADEKGKTKKADTPAKKAPKTSEPGDGTKPRKKPKSDEPAATAKKPPRPKVAADDVYFGDRKTFSKPAEVDADRVYGEIPAYKELLELKLKPSQPKYQLLMAKASRAFSRAVRKAAKKHAYDLVAKPGSVKGAKEVADITQHVIDAL